jgi:hypothetical protein
MLNNKIICPNCKTEISVDEVLAHQIGDELRKKFEADQKIKEDEIDQKKKALEEQEKRINDARNNVQLLVNQGVSKALEIEKAKLKETIKEEAKKETADEIKMLSEKLEEKDKKLEESRKMELDLRKEKNLLEENKKNFELEKQRQLDAERGKIAEDAAKKASEEQQYKLAELSKQLNDAMKVNDELKRKLQQGSQQTQGEVQELKLEELLTAEFTRDEIIPVGKGENGADITQKVFDNFGHHCGTIVWESKHTKAWTDGWIPKLKDDQRNAKAEIAVIVTTVLPKDMKNFGQKDGVWITDFASFLGLALALRTNLLQLTSLKLANVGKNEKMEVLFNYLTGTGFNQRVEAIVEAFRGLRTDLQKEKDSYTKIWAKRESQINRVIENTIGMYGDLEDLTGQALPKIESLELPSGDL